MQILKNLRKISNLPLKVAFKKVKRIVFEKFGFRRSSNNNPIIINELDNNATILDYSQNSLNYYKNLLNENYINQLKNKKIEILNKEIVGSMHDYLNTCPISNMQFPKIHPSKVPIKLNENSDIKYLWDLGRLNHIVYLALNSYINNDNECAKLALDYLEEFENETKDQLGVHWKSPMEVGIRAVNVLLCFELLYQANYIKSIEDKYVKYIELHFNYLWNNLEYADGMPANHYFTNICCLALICLKLDKTTEIQGIFEFAFLEFAHQLHSQFLEDGGNFEASTAYNRFMCEFAVFTQRAIKANGNRFLENSSGATENKAKNIRVSAKLSELKTFEVLYFIDRKLSKAHNFYKNLKESELELPLNIGDEDGGYFPGILYPGVDLHKSTMVKLYSSEYEKLYSPPNVNLFPAKHNPQFGLNFIEKEDWKLYLRNGNKNQYGKGGHAHNDNLSIIVYCKEKPLLVDAGNFTYTGDIASRNLYRSTKMHNNFFDVSSEIDNFGLGFEDLFWYKSDKYSVENHQKSDGIESKFYQNKQYLMRDVQINFKRNVQIIGNKITIIDTTNSSNLQSGNLHFAPKVKLSLRTANELIAEIDEIRIALTGNFGNLKIEEYMYSKTYGQQESAKKISYTFDKQCNWSIEQI